MKSCENSINGIITSEPLFLVECVGRCVFRVNAPRHFKTILAVDAVVGHAYRASGRTDQLCIAIPLLFM